MEDKDANCRLRHGLNVHCLAHIFQYLNSVDLYTVGEMNGFYKQIINDLVISKHEINFDKLYKRRITISQVFKRYGKQIRKINFIDRNEKHTIEQLIYSIHHYCATDQLKSAVIVCSRNVFLTNQFRKVEKLVFSGGGQLLAQLSGSLRCLRLDDIDLDPNFNWKKLTNLKEIYLSEVRGIKPQKFIHFLQQRPKLQIFHHDRYSFKDATQLVCETLAKCCGNQIREYSGIMPTSQEDAEASEGNMFEFISGLKHLKKVCLATHQICGGDIIDAMKRLAENDSIEALCIKYTQHDRLNRQNADCIFLDRPNLDGFDMMQFSRLKMVKIYGHGGRLDDTFFHGQICEQFKLLRVYASQMLTNVKHLTISSVAEDWNIIKVVPKLRYLVLDLVLLTPKQAVQILLTLERILRTRNNGQTRGDFIEIKFERRDVYKLFDDINGRSTSIRLSMVK